ncbi:MAG: hypothetical protein WDO17_18255 [Alphaproteobacteria bacterium]
MANSVVGTALLRSSIRALVGFLLLTAAWIWTAGGAHACSCEEMSPAEGFERAQYVFSGKVVEAGAHTWVVEVDRVWKGRETLTHKARLMDVYAKMDCESFFKEGERYLFFAIVAKGPRDVFYHPQVCNWTSPLQSRRVAAPNGASVWLEDLIIREHGPGEPPGEESGSGRLP